MRLTLKPFVIACLFAASYANQSVQEPSLVPLHILGSDHLLNELVQIAVDYNEQGEVAPGLASEYASRDKKKCDCELDALLKRAIVASLLLPLDKDLMKKFTPPDGSGSLPVVRLSELADTLVVRLEVRCRQKGRSETAVDVCRCDWRWEPPPDSDVGRSLREHLVKNRYRFHNYRVLCMPGWDQQGGVYRLRLVTTFLQSVFDRPATVALGGLPGSDQVGPDSQGPSLGQFAEVLNKHRSLASPESAFRKAVFASVCESETISQSSLKDITDDLLKGFSKYPTFKEAIEAFWSAVRSYTLPDLLRKEGCPSADSAAQEICKQMTAQELAEELKKLKATQPCSFRALGSYYVEDGKRWVVLQEDTGENDAVSTSELERLLGQLDAQSGNPPAEVAYAYRDGALWKLFNVRIVVAGSGP